jgi:hypothetical protein
VLAKIDTDADAVQVAEDVAAAEVGLQAVVDAAGDQLAVLAPVGDEDPRHPGVSRAFGAGAEPAQRKGSSAVSPTPPVKILPRR